jgi:hypothetical protein
VGYWGGRFHGVFPVTEGKVLDAWWPALQHLDPDIVVTNTDLLPACLDRIERSILPAHYLGLGASERDRCNDPFVPIYGLQLLDICAIPQIMWADRGPLQDPLFIRFKRRQPVDDIHRVILRNFGALHDDVQTTAAFRDLPLQDIDDRALTLDALFSQLTEIGNRAVLPVDLACYAAAFPANLEYSPRVSPDDWRQLPGRFLPLEPSILRQIRSRAGVVMASFRRRAGRSHPRIGCSMD